jgi:hypothetical protein
MGLTGIFPLPLLDCFTVALICTSGGQLEEKDQPGFDLLLAGLPVQAQADYLKEAETKARDLLKKAIEAMGGEAYLNIQDVQRTGKFYQFSKDDLRGASPFQSFDKFPLKQRFEMGKKAEIVNINDGDDAWKIEYKVVKNQSPEEINLYKAGLKHSLDHILRERINEPDMKFRYLGKSRIDLARSSVFS